MIKFTEWFAGVNPVHVGVYQTMIDETVFFQHWNGEYWGAPQQSAQAAWVSRGWESEHQSMPWRGLTSEIR